jgi:hypothetical protein
VNVYGGICDHPDLCEIEECKFYNTTPEGTFRFIELMKDSKSSILGVLEDKRKGERKLMIQELSLKLIKGGA